MGLLERVSEQRRRRLDLFGRRRGASGGSLGEFGLNFVEGGWVGFCLALPEVREAVRAPDAPVQPGRDRRDGKLFRLQDQTHGGLRSRDGDEQEGLRRGGYPRGFEGFRDRGCGAREEVPREGLQGEQLPRWRTHQVQDVPERFQGAVRGVHEKHGAWGGLGGLELAVLVPLDCGTLLVPVQSPRVTPLVPVVRRSVVRGLQKDRRLLPTGCLALSRALFVLPLRFSLFHLSCSLPQKRRVEGEEDP